MVVGISGYFSHALNPMLLKFTEQAHKHGTCIHKTAGINHFYAILNAVAINTSEINS